MYAIKRANRLSHAFVHYVTARAGRRQGREARRGQAPKTNGGVCRLHHWYGLLVCRFVRYRWFPAVSPAWPERSLVLFPLQGWCMHFHACAGCNKPTVLNGNCLCLQGASRWALPRSNFPSLAPLSNSVMAQGCTCRVRWPFGGFLLMNGASSKRFT